MCLNNKKIKGKKPVYMRLSLMIGVVSIFGSENLLGNQNCLLDHLRLKDKFVKIVFSPPPLPPPTQIAINFRNVKLTKNISLSLLFR